MVNNNIVCNLRTLRIKCISTLGLLSSSLCNAVYYDVNLENLLRSLLFGKFNDLGRAIAQSALTDEVADSIPNLIIFMI